MNQMTDAQKAYIAGIIDGEGTICITKIPPKPEIQKKSYTYAPTIAVSMTSQCVIIWLQTVSGVGKVYFRKSSNHKCKDVWTWVCTVKSSRFLLNQIKDFLVLKREQANLFLELLDIKEINCGSSGRNLPEKQDEIFNRIKNLNKRGPVDVSHI